MGAKDNHVTEPVPHWEILVVEQGGANARGVSPSLTARALGSGWRLFWDLGVA